MLDHACGEVTYSYPNTSLGGFHKLKLTTVSIIVTLRGVGFQPGHNANFIYIQTIEITSEQRTRFNVPNGHFPIVLILYS